MSRPRFATPIPKCATEESVVEWLIAADNKNIPVPACGWCTDCLPEFQARMIKQGRCENINVEFSRTERGEVVGVIRG